MGSCHDMPPAASMASGQLPQCRRDSHDFQSTFVSMAVLGCLIDLPHHAVRDDWLDKETGASHTKLGCLPADFSSPQPRQ